MIQYIECRDAELTTIGIISDFTSLIWKTEYQGKGDFEIVVPFTDERWEWLQPDLFISRYDRAELGIIEKTTMKWAIGEGRQIQINGSFGLIYLERRVHCFNFNGNRAITRKVADGTNVEAYCRNIVNLNLISPVWGRRALSIIALGASQGLTATTDERYSTYQNALEFAVSLLGNTKEGDIYGHRMFFDKGAKKLNYEVFEGKDRGLIFSQEYRNLTSFTYKIDKELYKNLFAIGGEGDGKDRFWTYVDRENTVTGATDREFLFEASTSKTYTDESGTEITLTDVQYNQALKNECRGEFSEHFTAIDVSGEVDLQNLTFGEDYEVGDIVTIRDIESGIETKARIWSVTETQQEDYKIVADFEG